MKAIDYILGFGASAAAVVAAIYTGRFAAFAWRCHDIPLAMGCTFGAVWFSALAVKIAAWSTSGEIGGVSHGKSRNGEREACARA